MLRARREATSGEGGGLASNPRTLDHRTRMQDMTGAPLSGATPSDRARAEEEVSEGERRYLLVFHGATSWLHPLPASGEVIIGRSEAADLRIDHGSVSRQHARLGVDGDAVGAHA